MIIAINMLELLRRQRPGTDLLLFKREVIKAEKLFFNYSSPFALRSC